MNTKKTLVIFAIENALCKMGNPILDQVRDKLYSKHRCLLSDCYENPEYLSNVLKDLFGDSHKDIIKSIEKNLEDFEVEGPIGEFITKLEKTC